MNAFIVTIPAHWSDENRQSLYWRIWNRSFMILRDDGNFRRDRYSFITERQFADLDTVRKEFQIPAEISLIDGSQYNLSKM